MGVTLFVILLLGTMRPRVNVFHNNDIVKLVQFAALVLHLCLNNTLARIYKWVPKENGK